MTRTRTALLANLTVAVLCSIVAFLATARAEDGLKTIDNPGGGQVLYGPLPDESTLPGAMGTMLRNIHGHFGDRPQLGKFFQTRGSDSIAAFFTLTAKLQGNKPMHRDHLQSSGGDWKAFWRGLPGVQKRPRQSIPPIAARRIQAHQV